MREDSKLTMVTGAQPNGWTDERVELLKKLWMEGLSASQIAGELGEGVTRNAVIGKVHRLKLSARAKPTNTTPRARPAPRQAPRRPSGPSISAGVSTMAAAAKPRPQVMQRPQVMGATALAMSPQMDTELYVAPASQELFIPEDKRLSLLQLNEHTCKWPIGDPLAENFHFCGNDCADTGPYCRYHARIAFQPASERRRIR